MKTIFGLTYINHFNFQCLHWKRQSRCINSILLLFSMLLSVHCKSLEVSSIEMFYFNLDDHGFNNEDFKDTSVFPAEDCSDGIDNDVDGLVDCADLDCNGDPSCSDSDGDGYNDEIDLDDDNDGILDQDELTVSLSSYQPPCNLLSMNFIGPATLVAGVDLQVGAIYKYASVSTGIDAKVTIIAHINQSLPNVDNDGTDSNYFKPQSNYTLGNIGDRSYTEYLFEFVTSIAETPVVIPELFINFNDIDGNPGSGEQNWVEPPTNFIIDTPTDLDIEFGEWIIVTSDTTEYVGTSNTFPHGNFSARYINRSSVQIRLGVESRTGGLISGNRSHSIEFSCATNYLSPNTYFTDFDEDGYSNSIDLDSDNDGIYDCVESSSGQPHSSGVLTGGVDIYGIPLSVSNGSSGLNYIYDDSDSDSIINAYSYDSDGDGCKDVTEAGFPDTDGDGKLGGLVPPTVDSKGNVTSGGL